MVKLAAPFLTKCKRAPIPELSYICVENEMARITDLETELSFRLENTPDGLYDLINGELFLNDPKTEDYPVSAINNFKFTGKQLTLNQSGIKPSDLVSIAACRADDELRPIMNGVHFTSQRLEASDAHVLRVIPFHKSNNVKGEFKFVSPMPQVLLSALASVNEVTVSLYEFIHEEKSNEYYKTEVYYTFPESATLPAFTISIRAVEGNFPVCDSVMPHKNVHTHFIRLTTNQVADYAKFGRTIVKESGLMRFNNGTPSMQNIDLGLAKVFDPVEIVKMPATNYDGLIMPMMIKASDEPMELGENEFGINIFNIERVCKGLKGSIILGFQEYSRAIIFWLVPDNKPTRNPQPATCNPKPVQNKPALTQLLKVAAQSNRYSTSTDGPRILVVDNSVNEIVFQTYLLHDARHMANILNRLVDELASQPVPSVPTVPTVQPKPETTSHKSLPSSSKGEYPKGERVERVFRVIWSSAS